MQENTSIAVQWRCFLLLPNQKECNKKFADYYNLRIPTSPMYKISIYINLTIFMTTYGITIELIAERLVSRFGCT